MPLRKSPDQSPKLRRPNNPWTGKPYPQDGPALPVASPLDEPARQQQIADAREARGKIAARRLREEYAKHAYNMDSAPLRRKRLQYPSGPLSVGDLAALSGVSAKTIERIERNDGHQPIEVVWVALAAALSCRREQIDAGHIHA